MDSMRGEDVDWRASRLFGFVYRVDDEVMDLARDAYGKFIAENGLSPFAFPSLRRFETEVVAMTAALLGGDDRVVGTMTSGGTESILLAVKAARDHAREAHPEITAPELVMPVTAHPAWDKAAHLLNLGVVHVPVRDDYRADPAAMARACTASTVLMVASAPTYPHGVVDPLRELSEFALERRVWLHVDACLGGFVLPFARRAGYPIPDFDFSLPGVISMSADVHKYGYAAKGASTVLYRDPSYRKHQFYVHADWPGGVYGTPSLLGARPGGAIAAAWAVMNFLGEEGYTEIVSSMMATTRRLIEGTRAVPGLKVLGDPDASIFAIASDSLNIFALGDAMKRRGWHMDPQQLPPALHVTVSPGHARVVEPFLQDLAAAADEVRDLPETDLSGMAAMYGMLGSLPDRAMARELVLSTLDGLYRAG
jgi:glutamate/tyrosine decarboxylase-like PLP-dependent enzyme